MADLPLMVEPAAPEAIPQILHALYAHFDEATRGLHVERLLRCLESEELLPEGVLIARRGDRVSAAMICTYFEGASGLVWVPRRFTAEESEAVEDALVQAAHAWLRQSGCKLSQAVLATDELPASGALLRNGFRYVTRMHWLRHDLSPSPVDGFCPIAGLRCEPVGKLTQELFEHTLLRSYEDSADFPELNDVRTVDEILAGHQAPPAGGPEAWWLVLENGKAIGVLLLAELGELNRWELSYLGIVPEARGHGLGKALTRFAIEHVRAVGGTQLSVTADQRNQSALMLYSAAGFVPYDQREILLCLYQ